MLALDLGLGHPLTGPVYVEGAEPGDVVDIELLAYETADFGITAVIPGFGFLADLFTEPYRGLGDRRTGWPARRNCPAWPSRATFAGVIGVAPSRERMDEIARREQALAETAHPSPTPCRRRRSRRGKSRPADDPTREIGGNLDIRQLVAGRASAAGTRAGCAVLDRRPALRPGRR